MADRQIQTSGILSSQAQVYQKTNDILAQIQIHADQGCTHCLAIIKSGLGNQPNHATEQPIPGPTRNDQG
jgi:hypothetical protein